MSSTKHRRTRSVSSLDFNEAMSSFQTMFPSEDVRVIEAVLHSYDGSVDCAIDQLLSIDSVTRRAILSNRDDSCCSGNSDGKLSNSDTQSLSDVMPTSSCRHQLQYRLALRNKLRTCSTGSRSNVPATFHAIRCQSQSQIHSDSSSMHGMHSTVHKVRSNDDINVVRALGSFSSVTSEPPKETAESGVQLDHVATEILRDDDVIDVTARSRDFVRSLSSMTSHDVVDCTPFDVGMRCVNEEQLLAAPASLHVDRNGPGTRDASHRGNTPVINVFRRSTAAISNSNSISDNEVFVN